MNTMYNDNNLRTIADLVGFLNNPVVVDITIVESSEERSDWIIEHLRRFKYHTLKKKDKGVVLKYLRRITTLTEKQLDRHVYAFKSGRRICEKLRYSHFFQFNNQVLSLTVS